MSHKIECVACGVSWVSLTKINAEFEFNLLKAKYTMLRRALEEIEEREWDIHSSELARKALEEF